jgi:murein DD-endopeptidase MepM/ murein hydrolase activator NlpD
MGLRPASGYWFEPRAMGDIPEFTWPASGHMHLMIVQRSGFHAKIALPHDGVVSPVAKGLVIRAKSISTRRIVRHYDVHIRHDDGFESKYDIVDQTPGANAVRLPKEGEPIEAGAEICYILNGGYLHFQLLREGRMLDPRRHIACPFNGLIEVTHKPAAG